MPSVEKKFDITCQFCRKVYDKSDAEDSHGVCPECLPAYRQELEDFRQWNKTRKEAIEQDAKID